MRYTFADFVGKFPTVPMPIILGEDTHHVFAQENEPLPDSMIAQFIHPTEGAGFVDDPYTEYVPCFAIDDTSNFIALVWWKAELLNYEYVLATFTNKGDLIDRQVIAFTRVQDGRIVRAITTIDEEWVIFIAEGESAEGDAFDPSTSRMRDMEIMVNGTIV